MASPRGHWSIPDLLTRACSSCRCVKRGSTRTATTYKVSVSGDEVRDSPSIEAGGELSNDDERRLYQHYDMAYPEEDTRVDDASTSGTQDQQDQAGADTRSSTRLPRILRRFLHPCRD